MMGEGRIHTKGKKVGHCHVSQRLLSMIEGYHLFVDNFYTSVPLFKNSFSHAIPATGTIIETRRNFPATLKNSKAWAKGKERGAMPWERDTPCLALQWIDNKVVPLLTTIDNANCQLSAKCICASSF